MTEEEKANVHTTLGLMRDRLEQIGKHVEGLDTLMWRSRNGGKPGLVPTVEKIDESMQSIRNYLRMILGSALLGFLGVVTMLVVERMAAK